MQCTCERLHARTKSYTIASTHCTLAKLLYCGVVVRCNVSHMCLVTCLCVCVWVQCFSEAQCVYVSVDFGVYVYMRLRVWCTEWVPDNATRRRCGVVLCGMACIIRLGEESAALEELCCNVEVPYTCV